MIKVWAVVVCTCCTLVKEESPESCRRQNRVCGSALEGEGLQMRGGPSTSIAQHLLELIHRQTVQ